MENIENIIESILFVAGEPIPVSDLCFKFNLKPKEMEKIIAKLQEKYAGDSGINLLYFNNKLQFSSNPKYVDEVSLVLNPIRQRNLTRSTLETVAIIAYKQPITRMEIEEIRGVGADYAMNILLEHKLIEVVGHKDTVGHPTLFGTTDEFLKRFDISSLDELPDYDTLMQEIEKIRESYSDTMFDSAESVERISESEVDKKLDELSKAETSETYEEL